MSKVFRWIVVVSLLFASRAWTEPVLGTVHFTLYWNYLIVANGSVGTLKGLNFLVDTGANPTVIDAQLARGLRLAGQPASLRTVGGLISATRAVAPSVTLGAAHREQLPVMVEDLSFFEKALPIHIDAIVGLDVLGQTALVIDYRRRTLQFGPAAALENAFPLAFRNGLAFVPSEVNGVAAHLVLDTGAASLIMYSGNRPRSSAAISISQKRSSPGTTGELAHTEAKLPSLLLGNTDFGRQTAWLVTEESPQPGIDGLVNPAMLGVRAVAFDFVRGQVALVR